MVISKKELTGIIQLLHRWKKRVNKPISIHLACLFGLLALNLIYSFIYLRGFWQGEVVGGYDGAGHFGVLTFYAQHIFPHVSGWVSTWYGGMPWPIAYPPLLSYLVGVLAFLLPANLDLAFKALVIMMILSFPWLVYALALRLKFSQAEAFLAGVLGVFFLINANDLHYGLGLTMRGTFAIGMYPQLFASYLMVLWLYFLYDSHLRRRSYYLSIFLLAAVILSNLHTGEAAIFLFLAFVGVQRWLHPGENYIKKYGWYGLAVAGLVAFWFFPVLENARYFSSITMPPMPGGDLFQITSLSLIGASLIGVVGLRRRHESVTILFVSGLLVFLFVTIPLQRFFPGLPIQPSRSLPIAVLLFTMLFPLGLTMIFKYLGLGRREKLAAALILLSPFVYWSRPVHLTIAGDYKLSPQEKALVVYMKEKTDGRSVIEAWEEYVDHPHQGHIRQSTYTMLAALIGSGGKHQTLWTVFRESSINSPFVQPVRNLFSYHSEYFGVTCWLCEDKRFQKGSVNPEDIRLDLQRAELMGVKYFLVRSPEQVSRLATWEEYGLVLDKQFGPWYVFRLNRQIPLAVTLGKEPVLTFVHIARGDRPETELDWLRLNEEWLRHGNFSNVLARAPSDSLDEFSRQVEGFTTALLVDYRYRDFEGTLAQLEAFARKNTLILLSSDDPLFVKLAAKDNPRIQVLQRTGKTRTDAARLFTLIDEVSQPITARSAISHYRVTTNSQEFGLGNASEAPWVYLKSTHFPWWKGAAGERVYMASPVWTLVRPERSGVTKLLFQPSAFSRSGIFTTCFTGAALFLLMARRWQLQRKNKPSKNPA